MWGFFVAIKKGDIISTAPLVFIIILY